MSALPEQFEISIRARRGLLQLDLGELWEYRDLIFTFVRRDFLAKYAQTALGPAWFVLAPLMTSLVFTVIFSKVAKISTSGLPGMLFYMSALLPWGYFSQTFNAVSYTFTANRSIISKVYFPRLVLPLSAIVSNVLALGIQFLSFAGFWIYFKWFTDQGGTFRLDLSLALLPVVLLYTAIIGLAFGLWMAALTAKYRDFQHIIPFIVQLWMYATPIIYPTALVPEWLRPWIALNPMVAVTEYFRLALLGNGLVEVRDLLVSMIVTLIVLVPGLVFFQHVDRNAVDTI